MKAPRLSRSKSRHDSTPATANKARDTRPGAALPVKTSFDDLRTLGGRQKLKEQLSTAFTDSHAASIASSPSAVSMVGGNWLAASSSSSLESSAPKRPSTLPEQQQQPATIDVEQAIHLLTELKKTATPDQLVALHKALLPTRDSIISTADSSPGNPRASMIRQKSMLPPGLATRGGADHDLLKRQEDVEPALKRQVARSDKHLRVESNTSIAALDLADDAANPLPALRAVTPNDEHYFGAFRPGTLRVTNGSASPEPSLQPKPSIEALGMAATDEQINIGRARSESLAQELLEAQDMQSIVNDDSLKKPAHKHSGKVVRPLVLPSRSRDPSESRTRQPSQTRYGAPSPSQSREPSQTRKGRSRPSPPESVASSTPLAHSREPSLTRVPAHKETKSIKPGQTASKKPSIDNLLRRSIDSIQIRKSFDDGRVSPLDGPPRFAQRWSHRASQISQEYMADCEVPVSPFEDRQQAMAFASRLSTVFDGEDAEDTTTETPEAALSKLEGTVRDDEEHSAERRSLKATAEGLNSVARPPLLSRSSAPRSKPSKADSGYVSDASHQSAPRDHAYDVTVAHPQSPVAYDRPQPETKQTVIHLVPGTQDTPKQVSPMPSPLSDMSAQTRPEISAKRSSFIKLAGLKSSLTSSKTSPQAHDSLASSAASDEATMSSPAEAKSSRSLKKLQKKMPEEMKQQRRAMREQAKQQQLAVSTTSLATSIEPYADLVSSPLPMSQPPTPITMTAPEVSLDAQRESLPVELAGDSAQTAEPITDESTTASKPPLTDRQGRKSRRRSRATTVTAVAPTTDTEDATDEKPRKRSFSLGRKRSKSKRRSGSMTPKRKGEDTPAVPSIAALSATWVENGSQESLPLYSDYGSVSQSLGSHPYDISTSMFKQHNASRPVLDRVQSPHQITTTFVTRSKTGGLRGMDSAMASDLARRKSRDVAMHNNEDLYDAPRSATPKKRSQTDVPRARNSMSDAKVAGNHAPGWHTKPVFSRQGSLEALQRSLQERPHSIADSIPSLPELPADAEVRSVKAAEYLAKLQKDISASPILADSPSPLPSPNPGGTDFAGFSDESIANAVAKAVEARRAKRRELVKQVQGADRLRPAGPRMHSDASGSSENVSLQLHTPDERPHSDASTSAHLSAASNQDNQGSRPSTGAAQYHVDEPTVWQRQAQLWRQKRESVGQSLTAATGADVATQPVSSPSLVTSPPTTPSAREHLPSAHRRRQSASEHAAVYMDLLHGDSSDDNGTSNTNRASVQSTSTVAGHASTGAFTIEHAMPAKMYQASPIQRVRSPGGRVRTPSGSFYPYQPDHAAQAERSRASCLMQAAAEQSRVTRSLDIQRRPPQHAHNGSMDSIPSRYDRPLSPVPASEAGSIETGGPQQVTGPGEGPLSDRYSGGLQYGYQRGFGLQGSSGMRSSAVAKAQTSGNRFSHQFGLDLGDVPMFLSKVQ